MARLLLYGVFLCCCLWFVSATTRRPYFTGAVYEHRRLGSPEYDSSDVIIQLNLDYYRRAAHVAKLKEADLIVFPEYGIFPPGNRAQLKQFLEYIPDPLTERINPCEEPNKYSDRPIIYALSCIASDNAMVVVANTGDLQDCRGEEECPPDGVFHFNTNVVFDREGTMILKYHNEHLFIKLGMDNARKQQNTIFHTDFGTFATYIYFDIVFPRMAKAGGMEHGVDAVLFPTWWIDAFPQFVSVQYWQSWALGNDVTLLAANAHIPGLHAVGSGIFHHKDGALAYTFNPDGISKLVVANVPRKGYPSVSPNASVTAIELKGSWEMNNKGDAVPAQCSRTLLKDSTDVNHDYRCLEANIENYSFVKLNNPIGRVISCNNGLCCSLDYTTRSGFGHENFYLAVFNGTYNALGRYSWCEEDCVLARCEPHHGVPCAIFPLQSNTVFQDVHMRANFTSDITYPQVVGSGMRLVPLTDWHQYSGASSYNPYHLSPHFEHSHHHSRYQIGEKSLHFKNKSGRRLISLGMKGRCYERDPPIQVDHTPYTSRPSSLYE